MPNRGYKEESNTTSSPSGEQESLKRRAVRSSLVGKRSKDSLVAVVWFNVHGSWIHGGTFTRAKCIDTVRLETYRTLTNIANSSKVRVSDCSLAIRSKVVTNDKSV